MALHNNVHVKLVGEDGNAFAIIGRCMSAARKAGLSRDEVEAFRMEAMEGEDADEFGEKIFDLSKQGCNFRVKVEEQGGYPTYVSSRFASPSEISGVTDSTIKDVYDQTFDLENVFPVKSYEELQTMLNEHYHGVTEDSGEGDLPKQSTSTSVEEDDDLNFDDLDTTSNNDSKSSTIDDDKVKELLDTLE